MNLYFLVEGRRSEPKIYPGWFSYLIPGINEIKDPFLLNKNSSLDNTFYIFSGNGYPSLLNHLENAMRDVNKIPRINHFVVCLDSEGKTVAETKGAVFDYIQKNGLLLSHAKVSVFVQNCCIETWLLGNRTIFHRTPTEKDLLDCISLYDVSKDDPELMRNIPVGYNYAQYHCHYLKQIFKSRSIAYTKKNPGEAAKSYYLEELGRRCLDTGHLSSFSEFLDFCFSFQIKNSDGNKTI